MRRLREKLLAFLVVGAAPLIGAERNQEWKTVYETLKSPRVADSAWTVVDTIALRFPDFSVDLFSGQIVPLHAQTGITGWLFDGEALIRFAPRHHLEQHQLRRFIDDTVLVGELRQLVIRFASPLPRPTGVVTNGRHTLSTETLQFNERVQSQLLLRRGYNLPARLLTDQCAGGKSDFAFCAFTSWSPSDFSPPLYIYFFDPSMRESVRFYQSYEQRSGTPFYTLCSYGLEDLYYTTSDSILPMTPYLTKYNGWVEARPSGDIRVDMGCDIFLNRQPLPVLQLDIGREFSVQNIRDENGDTLGFIQEPGESAFTILSPAPHPLDTLRLLISYEGRGLKAGTAGDFYLNDPIYWLPRLGYLRRAVHKIVVKYPDGKPLVGVGKPSAPWRDRSFTLKYLNANTPAKAFAFAFGRFMNDSLKVGDRLTLQIFSTPVHSAAARRSVLEDIGTSLQFFEDRLGPYPLPYLDILEAPGIDSQGLPGLVMLSWVSFHSHVTGVMEMLRGHEVVHQWFGNAVGWATYHDQWLSEGIAEYLGAIFMQAALAGGKYLNQQLEAWRDDLITGRHQAARTDWQRFGALSLAKSEGRAAGPIWMGIRLGEKHGIDYYLQTYEKGAWVMHMLRRLLTNDDTGSDTTFWKLLADFYTTFAQKDPSTFDFQKVVERHIGMPMDWFFRQWILGTEIPSYEWNVRTEKIGKNDFLLRGIVRQKGTSSYFRVPVPIAFEFGKNERRIERVWVTGNETTFAYRLSHKPKRIIFNYDMAVLCEAQKRNLPIPTSTLPSEIGAF